MQIMPLFALIVKSAQKFQCAVFRVILPIMQSYSYAGNFTVRGKIKTALYENALWYGSYLVIFVILLVYVIVKPELKLDG